MIVVIQKLFSEAIVMFQLIKVIRWRIAVSVLFTLLILLQEKHCIVAVDSRKSLAKKTKAEKHVTFCYSSAIQRIVSVCSGIISVLPCSDFPSKYYFPPTGFAQRNLRASKKKQIVLDTQVFYHENISLLLCQF